MTKCQARRKFWHLELFWWDLLCNLTLSHFLGRTSKKPPCMISHQWYDIFNTMTIHLQGVGQSSSSVRSGQSNLVSQRWEKSIQAPSLHLGNVFKNNANHIIFFYLIVFQWPEISETAVTITVLFVLQLKKVTQKCGTSYETLLSDHPCSNHSCLSIWAIWFAITALEVRNASLVQAARELRPLANDHPESVFWGGCVRV